MIKDVLIPFLISIIVTFSICFLIFYEVLEPYLQANEIKVVDLDYILSSYEKLVQEKKMSIEDYTIKAKELRKLLKAQNGIVVNKYIKFQDGKLYPVVFRGQDITALIQAQLEEDEERE